MPDLVLHASLRVEGSRISVDLRSIPSIGNLSPRPGEQYPLGESCLEVIKRLQLCLHLGDDTHPSEQDWFSYLGRQLNGYLFADSRLRDRMRDRLKKGIEAHGRVRLILEFEPDPLAAPLACLPWEYLVVDDLEDSPTNEPDAPLGAHERLTVSRLVRTHEGDVPPLVDKLRVLLIAGQSSLGGDVAPADVERAIRDALNEGNQVDFMTGARLAELIRAERQLEHCYDVVHFLGHGSEDTNPQSKKLETALLVSTKHDERFRISASAFADAVKGRCRVVVMQSCTTLRAAPAILAAGPQAVVAMQHPVHRDRSTNFVVKLYENLSQNCTLDIAVQKARTAYANRGTFGAALLFVRTTDELRLNTIPGRRPDAKRSAVNGLGQDTESTAAHGLPRGSETHEPSSVRGSSDANTGLVPPATAGAKVHELRNQLSVGRSR